ncbi:AAA family ATPase [uncultured Anaerofustis sp.]|uniref:ATP-dependent metallopeptidase FtsH/Yme1/Tma family protein n=1 Tax=uncultured Anaerofustis sp. TaxID=904996 RepID=UPI0025DE350A|nr:AAA family ATPase [uncultured Anaerofustis sp.]
MKNSYIKFMGNRPEDPAVIKSDINFTNVAGLDEIKEELLEISDFLTKPAKYKKFGAKIPSGVLLYGPPGTGKTLIAKALAGECGATFMYASGSEFIEKFVGIGASRIRALFDKARKKAPAIIFIDELDAIGVSRSTDNNSERDQTLNQFLIELDGFSENTGVVVMAATNRMDMLDSALLRPGRFDRHIYVGNPSSITRKEILNHHMQGKPVSKNLDINKVVEKTNGLSGAHLANIVNESALMAIRQGRKVITNDEFDKAIIKTMAGLKNKSMILNNKEKRIVSFHEAGHALVSFILTGVLPDKVTIVPYGVSLGFVLTGSGEDNLILTKKELEEKICMLLAGRASEEIIFGEISTGAQNDIAKANELANSMVCEYGMSKYKNKTFDIKNDTIFKDEIDEEVTKILDTTYLRAKEIIKSNVEAINKLAKLLYKKEDLSSKDLEKIFDTALV